MDGCFRKGLFIMGINYFNGVMVYFNLDDFFEKEVKLSFLKMNNDIIKFFSSKGKKDKFLVKKGGNLFVWDIEGDGVEWFDGMIFWWVSIDVFKVVFSMYKVVL